MLQDTANKRNFKGKKNLLKEGLKQNIFYGKYGWYQLHNKYQDDVLSEISYFNVF